MLLRGAAPYCVLCCLVLSCVSLSWRERLGVREWVCKWMKVPYTSKRPTRIIRNDFCIIRVTTLATNRTSQNAYVIRPLPHTRENNKQTVGGKVKKNSLCLLESVETATHEICMLLMIYICTHIFEDTYVRCAVLYCVVFCRIVPCSLV
jgi:hypothetical protein